MNCWLKNTVLVAYKFIVCIHTAHWNVTKHARLALRAVPGLVCTRGFVACLVVHHAFDSLATSAAPRFYPAGISALLSVARSVLKATGTAIVALIRVTLEWIFSK
jgi:hypothetical protein